MAVHHVVHHEGDSMGALFTIMVLIIVSIILWYWGLPLLKQSAEQGIKIEVPSNIEVTVVPQQPAQQE